MAVTKQVTKAPTPRARFVGTAETSPSTLPSLPSALCWLPTLSAPAPFSLANFCQAVELQTLHPEYNSSTILRADVLVDEDLEERAEQPIVEMEGYGCVRRIRRKLQPKQTRDGSMEQECLFYRTAGREEDAGDAEGLVLLLPDFELLEKENGGLVPYYHPQLAALAFRYLPQSSLSTSSDSQPPSASIHLDVLALPSLPLPTPLPLDHRIYRTALALLKSLHSVACGLDEGYQKRVHHDLLAGKEEVQDLYHALKEKYR
jgi:tRNASer (uridine44-2'-O)-methyltransferase